jgi:uncharacterized protein YbjT (DUF2867 family)
LICFCALLHRSAIRLWIIPKLITHSVQAGGNLGSTVLKTFLDESSFETTVLSRQGSSSTFPPGVKVIHADYGSSDSLREAFKGQDVVLSLVGGFAIGDQDKFIDAAIAAGVQRFIPSEYGNDTADARVRAIVPHLAGKYDSTQYLKSKEDQISWTSVVTGPFFDWCLAKGIFGLNHANRTATVYDNGAATFSATNLHTVALALVKVLEKPEDSKNRYIYLSGFQISQKQILEAAEKVTGEKWTVNHETANRLLEEGNAKIKTGDYSGILLLIQGITFGAKDELGKIEPEALWNEKLGLPKDDLEKSVRAVFNGKLAHEQ